MERDFSLREFLRKPQSSLDDDVHPRRRNCECLGVVPAQRAEFLRKMERRRADRKIDGRAPRLCKLLRDEESLFLILGFSLVCVIKENDNLLLSGFGQMLE